MNNLLIGFCKRTSFYKNLQNFNRDFISSISFSNEDLFFLLSKDYNDESLNQTLKSVIEVIRGNKTAYLYPSFLTNREKEELTRYFKRLGSFDLNTQLQLLTRFESVFENIVQNCITSENKEGALCKKMGIIVGIMTFIIVV